jgi:hypothetical protein
MTTTIKFEFVMRIRDIEYIPYGRAVIGRRERRENHKTNIIS